MYNILDLATVDDNPQPLPSCGPAEESLSIVSLW